jgi:hypothetical protein
VDPRVSLAAVDVVKKCEPFIQVKRLLKSPNPSHLNRRIQEDGGYGGYYTDTYKCFLKRLTEPFKFIYTVFRNSVPAHGGLRGEGWKPRNCTPPIPFIKKRIEKMRNYIKYYYKELLLLSF